MGNDERPPDHPAFHLPDNSRLVEAFHNGATALMKQHGEETARVKLSMTGADETTLHNSALYSGQRVNAESVRYREQARRDISSFMERVFEFGFVISEGAADVHIHRNSFQDLLNSWPRCLVDEADYSFYYEQPERYSLIRWTGRLANLLTVERTILISNDTPGDYRAWGLSKIGLTAAIDDNGRQARVFQHYVDAADGEYGPADALANLDSPPAPLRTARHMSSQLDAGIVALSRLVYDTSPS